MDDMNKPEISSAFVLGMLIKWAIIIAIALVLLQFLMWMAAPVIEQATDLLGSIGYRSHSGNGPYSLAVLCVILIGIVGAIKAMKK